MDRLIAALEAVAKKTEYDGTPVYEVKANGVVVNVAVETDEEFDTAADAVSRAFKLVKELLAADDYEAVSGADIGAACNVQPETRNGPTHLWRASVRLTLAPSPLDQQRDVPFFPVSGLPE